MSHVNLKKKTRIRRSLKTRAHIRRLGAARLVVMRSSKHIYAQVIMAGAQGDNVLASASTLGKDFSAAGGEKTGNIAAAAIVGKLLAERCLAAGVKAVAFDRSGFKYHGRVKALADAAREGGLAF